MKVYASGLDLNKKLDAYFKEHFFVIPDITLVSDINTADCVFICLSLNCSFVLNKATIEAIKISDKPVVVFDYTEFGDGSYRGQAEYKKFMQGHRVFGYNYSSNIGKMMEYPEYKNLYVALRDIRSKIKCYFMREYSSLYDYNQCGFPVHPCDYVLNNLKVGLFSKEQFDSRPIAVTFIGGSGTNPRTKMIGKLYTWAANHKHLVVSTKTQHDYYTKRGRKKLVALFHIEGGLDQRIDFRPVYSNSKIVIDIAGSGIKCVRNAESAIYAASTKQISGLKFSYDWTDLVNCIELDFDPVTNELLFDKIIPKIDSCFLDKNSDMLYNIYQAGHENAVKYCSANYMKDYVLSTIWRYL